jgi:phosphohistidine swiveling domain-containing protein
MERMLLRLEEIGPEDRPACGSKAYNLARLHAAGIRVPPGVCVTTAAYEAYMQETGMAGRILIEFNRKPFDAMRWEELWDAALRIRTMFATTPLPPHLREAMVAGLDGFVRDSSVVVRSSSIAEDTPGASFAGLHESFVNVRGIKAVIDRIRLVWASLWSDRALLYRRELGLSVETSAMAVLVQPVVAGEASGVFFGKNPQDSDQMVIEAVWGLNEGLVDGTVEPDRWILDRTSRAILSTRAARRTTMVTASPEGTSIVPLPADRVQHPPLSAGDIDELVRIAGKAESIFGSPQDVEWTRTQGAIVVLQSRPVTALPGDGRSYYLGLRRSFSQLRDLRARVEGDLLPAMGREGERLAEVDLAMLDDEALSRELHRRRRIREHWQEVYDEEFIPLAHGVRLFGQVYNDAVRPEDPFEFTSLLAGTDLISIRRNRELEMFAARIREDPALRRTLEETGGEGATGAFAEALSGFLSRYRGSFEEGTGTRAGIVRLLLSMAAAPPSPHRDDPGTGSLEARFISHFTGEGKVFAGQVLDLARASYRLRDDDNHLMGTIEHEYERAIAEGRRRLRHRGMAGTDLIAMDEVEQALLDAAFTPAARSPPSPAPDRSHRVRQMTGQPASRGFARGTARVVRGASDAFYVREGEILVCDAIDPTITFVVSLCAGIIERRGGMLIHGAIIAREYGIPCVTGIPGATEIIATGDLVSVDGYLGLVTIRKDTGSGGALVSA